MFRHDVDKERTHCHAEAADEGIGQHGAHECITGNNSAKVTQARPTHHIICRIDGFGGHEINGFVADGHQYAADLTKPTSVSARLVTNGEAVAIVPARQRITDKEKTFSTTNSGRPCWELKGRRSRTIRCAPS